METMIRTYIIEDDFLFRSKVKELIQNIPLSDEYFSLEVISVENLDSFYFDLSDSILTIQDNDIFLVDIDFQTYYSGIDITKKIRKKNKNCFILFLTNLENKAIEIINHDIQPMSYIIKGTTFDPLLINNLFYSIKSKIIQRLQNKNNYISFKKFGEIVFVKYVDILYITSVFGMRNTLALHTKDSEQIIEGTINKLKKTIEVPYLYSGLKSYIINLNHVRSTSRSIGLITFDNGYELEVGVSIIDKLNRILY